MLPLDRILNQDRLLRAMTGLNRKGFEARWPSFAQAYERSLCKPLAERQRAAGGGRKARLRRTEEQLLDRLLDCKGYPTFDWLSVLFDFDRSCAHDGVHRLLPVLEHTLGETQVLPVRQLSRLAEFMERFPAVTEVMIAGTERPVQRPQDPARQKEPYSGNKKRQTRQHSTGSTRTKRVILLPQARAGTVQDKRPLAAAAIVEPIPEEVRVEGALGFQGLQQELVNVHLPHKKPQGKELTEQQKQENREFSGQRVACEQAHAGSKRYTSVAAV